MRAFLVGRFQPFHDGHRYVVEEIAAEADELVVGVGSADASHARANPFTAGERVEMLHGALADRDLETYVVPIPDVERNAIWASHVRSLCPAFEVAYSNNPLVVELLEADGVEVRQVPLHRRDTLEGTELRRRMIAGEDWRSHVPDPVVEVVERVDGVGRLRRVTQTDASGDRAGP